MSASDAVARIIDIKDVKGSHQAFEYANGHFYPLVPAASGGSSISVSAVVVRPKRGGASFAIAKRGSLLQLGDIVKTSPGCMLAIEFLVGGRVTVNRSVSVRVEGPKHVREVDATMKRSLGHSWHLFIHKSEGNRPIEIQTNGGTLGGLKG
jgi:hypothetical protein